VSDPWAEYLEALRVLDRAPAAARARQDRIEAEAERATEAADAALRSAVSRRETVERRIRELDERIRKVLAEECPPADGPASPVRLENPSTAAEALDTIDRVEQQFHDDLEHLLAARRLAARSTAWRWYALAAAAALVIATVVVFAIF
jgi:hypothetical protein